MSDTLETRVSVDVAAVLRQAAETNRQLMAAIEQMQAPAALGLAVMEDDECYGFSDAAKILNDKIEAETGRRIGRERLFIACRELGILQKSEAHRNEPYQQYEHHFKLVPKQTPVGMKVTPLFTGKGLAWILPKIVAYYR